MPRFDVVGVIVSDLQTAVVFYRRLGLEFPEALDPMGHGHVEAPLPGGLRFTLDTEETIRSFDPTWSPPTKGHRVALAFLCDSPGEVDRLYREVTECGVAGYKEPWDAFWASATHKSRIPTGT